MKNRVTIINVAGTENEDQARAAVIDLKDRIGLALSTHGQFFNSREHIKRVSAVRKIVNEFFPVRKSFYENPRVGRNTPFTVIKVEQPNWPRVSRDVAQSKFYKPLAEMNIEFKFNPNTNSWLFHVK